LLVVSDVT